ncbi:hypothetical protein MKEN_00839400 [Mycena kentingensis (nom. inval.)]|nr:hypothetical protein MKEN_00839400 [Mycena kentingensis (nom. inval.)]
MRRVKSKPSLRLHLRARLPSTASAPGLPRNSFTATDYYRETKDEIHSPISWAAQQHATAAPASTSASTHPTGALGFPIRASTYSADDDEGSDNEAGHGAENQPRQTLWNKVKRALAGRWGRARDAANNMNTAAAADALRSKSLPVLPGYVV